MKRQLTRRLIPNVEALETKTLLSYFGLGSTAQHHLLAQALTPGNPRIGSNWRSV